MAREVKSVYSRSGKGFVFTLEALVALMCFVAFIATLASIQSDGYSDVILYKQAGDYAQIAMKKHCEHDRECLAGLRALLGRSGTGEKCVTVTRTAVSKSLGYEDVTFELCV